MRLLTTVLAVMLAGAVASCGEQPAEPGGPAEPGISPSTTTPSAGEVTVRGTVKPGVEAGCLILDADGKQYLLMGDKERPKAGSVVEVKGRIDRSMMTTCMQGLPLVVTEVRPG